jgi:hypothetical protein
MRVQAGATPTLSRGPASAGASYIVLHFPPQALAEQVFFQAAVPGTKAPRVPDGAPPPSAPGANENPLPPPIRARIAGESRLAFKVPDGFSVPYQLADVLAACQQLAPNVPGNALPRGQGGLVVSAAALSATSLKKLSISQRAALSSFALRNLSLQAQDGSASPVLMSRVTQVGSSLGLKLSTTKVPSVRIKPRPGLPGDTQTAIEMPWRLILAPHAGERWRHAAEPVTSPVTQRTELWHSRLVAPGADRQVHRAAAARPGAHAARGVGAHRRRFRPGQADAKRLHHRGQPAQHGWQSRTLPCHAERLRPLPDHPPVLQLLSQQLHAAAAGHPPDAAVQPGRLARRARRLGPAWPVGRGMGAPRLDGPRPLRAGGLQGLPVPLRPPRGAHQGQRAQVPQRPLGHDTHRRQPRLPAPAHVHHRARARARFRRPAAANHRRQVDAAAVPVQQRAHRHQRHARHRPAGKAWRRRSAATAKRCSGPAWAGSPSPSAAWAPTSTAGVRSSSCR